MLCFTFKQAYPKTSTGKFSIPKVCKVLSIVVLGNENSRDRPPGHVPRYFSWDDEIRSNDNCPPGKFSRGEIHSNAQIEFFLFAISLWMKMCPKKHYSPLKNFNISPLHHNDFTISPYVQKILIHPYTI